MLTNTGLASAPRLITVLLEVASEQVLMIEAHTAGRSIQQTKQNKRLKNRMTGQSTAQIKDYVTCTLAGVN